MPCKAALIALTCLYFTAYVQAVEFPDRTFPNFYAMQLKGDCQDRATQEQVKTLGATWIRRGFYWKNMEAEQRGSYDFSGTDVLLNDAKELGLGIVVVLYGNPNNKLWEDDPLNGIQSEDGRKGFSDWARACAARYKDHKVIWEIWNEPNTMTFWHGTSKNKAAKKARGKVKGNSPEYADEYVALVKSVVPAMRAVDPDCTIIAGSVSNYWSKSYEWTEYCFKRGILQTGIDGWSVHPYGMKAPEQHKEGHDITRELMKKYNDGKLIPILNTERGFAVKKHHEGWSGGSLERAEEFQTWHMVRQHVLDARDDIRLSMWYEWKGGKFGLYDTDGRERPAFKVAQVMVQQLRGYTFSEQIPSENPLDYLIAFTNKDGKKIIVAWTTPPLKAEPDKYVEHSITIPHQGAYTHTSINGESKSDTATDTITVTLTGAPVYIRLN